MTDGGTKMDKYEGFKIDMIPKWLRITMILCKGFLILTPFTISSLMLMSNDTSIADGQYVAGIGFNGSDGHNENAHPSHSAAAIMIRAGESHGNGDQGVGMEFRLKQNEQYS